ncbi:ABC transporter permease [Parabacteroides sp. Marseille-P3160]|uniref:ABC transporter permease n=1 Tax=Parabacteroides sp. Marseille-P3160 TaxID=1917887 RepID=UPI0009BADEAF|nr:ABC transporter permease [Parabacteroides sp. Marseille-P3160]
MNLFSLSFKQIKSKPLSSLLNVILFAFGITIISFLLLVKDGFEEQMDKNVAGIDLVVGAKGSPMQLILSGIYHIDSPTGNISYEEAAGLSKHRLIKKAIPVSLGDSYHGYRIVGTVPDYPALYGGRLREGAEWKAPLEAAIGAKVARKAGLKVGDSFAGIHGLIEDAGHSHDDHKYKVVGIYEETGTVLDQLILTGLESVWAIHEHHGDGHAAEEHEDGEAGYEHSDEHESASDPAYEAEHAHGHEHEGEAHSENKEITCLLIQYKNPMGVITLPRLINSSTHMQAASPVMEINRMYSLMGVGIQTVNLIAWFIILISAFSIFISLFHSMKERKYELALIRVMGGSRMKLFSIVLAEGILIALIGYLCGFLLSRLGMWFLALYAESSIHYDLARWVGPSDLYFLLVSLGIGLAASVLPAVIALKTDIYKTLNE